MIEWIEWIEWIKWKSAFSGPSGLFLAQASACALSCSIHLVDNPQESRKQWMLWRMERAGRKNKNNNKFQFWQQHNQPIELDNNTIRQQKLEYLHNNPVNEGFVFRPEEYMYSSAGDYSGNKGLLSVELIR